MDIFDTHESFSQSVPVRRRFQVVIMATGAFAVPSIQALCESDQFEIVCLVTSPLRYDKNRRPIITPARQVAAECGLLISEQEDVSVEEFFEFLYLIRPDLIFVCDFGQILSKQTLSGAILGGINLHGSLLPRFRGAAPVNRAILTGEPYTGVSIIHMTPQIDAGPVIAQSPPIPISPYETAPELEERLAGYGAALVFDTIAKMAQNVTIRIIEQLHDRASQAPRLLKHDGFVPWEHSSLDVFNHYRATLPWPRAFTDWFRTEDAPLRLIMGEMIPLDDSLEEIIGIDYSQDVFVDPILTDAKIDNLAELKAMPKKMSAKRRSSGSKRPSWWKPGVVIQASEGVLLVAAKEGVVRITQIQPSGKKMMPVQDFLRGYPIKREDRLGTFSR